MIDLELTDQNQKEFEKAMSDEMDKVIKHFERELVTIRTGRAHPALVEGIKVSCYGGSSQMSIRELASVSAPGANLLVIEPWDKSIITEIEKAIGASDLGVTPENDGNIIRIRLPEMSSARREELTKILGKKLEEAKISIRNIRKDFHNLIRSSEKEKSISEDHARRLHDVLQDITDKYCKICDQMAEKKEKDIKTI